MSRSEDRSPISMIAQFRTPTLRMPMQVSDLSAGGCRIDVGRVQLAVGQWVVIKPEGFEGLSGTVVWCRDGYAGVKFHTSIYGPVVDHLCRIYPAPENTFEIELAA